MVGRFRWEIKCVCVMCMYVFRQIGQKDWGLQEIHDVLQFLWRQWLLPWDQEVNGPPLVQAPSAVNSALPWSSATMACRFPPAQAENLTVHRSRPSGPEQTSLACSLAFAKCGRRLSMLWDMPWQDITRSWSLELRLFKHPASCQQYSSQRATEAICEGSRICPGPS